MNLIYGSCFIVTITLGFSNAAVQEIPLYTGVLYTGNKTIVTIAADGNCTNLPELFQNNIKSTNIFAPCVQFYDGLDCSGKGIQLHPSSPYQSNLEIWRIHNKTMSLGNCRDSCIPSLGNSFEHLKAVQENKATNHDIPITIYSKPAYHGKEFKIQISGCTFLKHTHIYYTTFRSVRLPKGSCFLVFLGNNFVPPGGTGDPNDCFVTDAFNVLKFQDGMSGLHSFTDFVPSPNSSFIQKKYVKALSPCQCKSSEIVEPELNLTSGRGCIELYSEYRFVGRTIRIPLNFTGCMNFADSKYSEWEGIAYSMKTGAESCVELYSEGDCQGPTHLVVTLPFEIPSLSGYNLLGQIRSIQVCKYDSEHPMNVSKVRVKDGKYQMALYCLLPVAIIGVVTSIVLMMFLWHNKKALNKRSKLSEHEIELFFNGAELHHERTISQKNTQVDFLIQNQPYKYELEILPHRIKFGKHYTIHRF
ncbi:unnamed protein product [Orchesella dallaii]|uniref:Uncharacterized protein n=1 Tax=Orchesella dallaii TaxID=48710 RepID=A0ABP1R075_9HEXA